MFLISLCCSKIIAVVITAIFDKCLIFVSYVNRICDNIIVRSLWYFFRIQFFRITDWSFEVRETSTVETRNAISLIGRSIEGSVELLSLIGRSIEGSVELLSMNFSSSIEDLTEQLLLIFVSIERSMELLVPVSGPIEKSAELLLIMCCSSLEEKKVESLGSSDINLAAPFFFFAFSFFFWSCLFLDIFYLDPEHVLVSFPFYCYPYPYCEVNNYYSMTCYNKNWPGMLHL